jgi:hypothetical protein
MKKSVLIWFFMLILLIVPVGFASAACQTGYFLKTDSLKKEHCCKINAEEFIECGAASGCFPRATETVSYGCCTTCGGGKTVINYKTQKCTHGLVCNNGEEACGNKCIPSDRECCLSYLYVNGACVLGTGTAELCGANYVPLCKKSPDSYEYSDGERCCNKNDVYNFNAGMRCCGTLPNQMIYSSLGETCCSSSFLEFIGPTETFIAPGVGSTSAEEKEICSNEYNKRAQNRSVDFDYCRKFVEENKETFDDLSTDNPEYQLSVTSPVQYYDSNSPYLSTVAGYLTSKVEQGVKVDKDSWFGSAVDLWNTASYFSKEMNKFPTVKDEMFGKAASNANFSKYLSCLSILANNGVKGPTFEINADPSDYIRIVGNKLIYNGVSIDISQFKDSDTIRISQDKIQLITPDFDFAYNLEGDDRLDLINSIEKKEDGLYVFDSKGNPFSSFESLSGIVTYTPPAYADLVFEPPEGGGTSISEEGIFIDLRKDRLTDWYGMRVTSQGNAEPVKFYYYPTDAYFMMDNGGQVEFAKTTKTVDDIDINWDTGEIYYGPTDVQWVNRVEMSSTKMLLSQEDISSNIWFETQGTDTFRINVRTADNVVFKNMEDGSVKYSDYFHAGIDPVDNTLTINGQPGKSGLIVQTGDTLIKDYGGLKAMVAGQSVFVFEYPGRPLGIIGSVSAPLIFEKEGYGDYIKDIDYALIGRKVAGGVFGTELTGLATNTLDPRRTIQEAFTKASLEGYTLKTQSKLLTIDNVGLEDLRKEAEAINSIPENERTNVKYNWKTGEISGTLTGLPVQIGAMYALEMLKMSNTPEVQDFKGYSSTDSAISAFKEKGYSDSEIEAIKKTAESPLSKVEIPKIAKSALQRLDLDRTSVGFSYKPGEGGAGGTLDVVVNEVGVKGWATKSEARGVKSGQGVGAVLVVSPEAGSEKTGLAKFGENMEFLPKRLATGFRSLFKGQAFGAELKVNLDKMEVSSWAAGVQRP